MAERLMGRLGNDTVAQALKSASSDPGTGGPRAPACTEDELDLAGARGASDARHLQPERRDGASSPEALARRRQMKRDARRMWADVEQMRRGLDAQWERITQYLSAPKILSLAFFDPAFVVESDRHTVLEAALDAAAALTGADMGNVQLWEPERGVLRIEAQRGCAPSFLEFFAEVRDGQTACGVAWQRSARVIVENVADSPIFRETGGLDVMLHAGARAVQSMPLISGSGCLLGVLSTHWSHPRRPSERELRLLALLARRTAHLLEWKGRRRGGVWRG
jgi:hypothetical protein